MDEKIQAELKNAILQSLPMLQEVQTQCLEPYLVLKKEGNAWRGEWQQKPALYMMGLDAHAYLEESGASFTKQFFEHYPQYKGLVGAGGFNMTNFGQAPAHLFMQVLSRLWGRYGTFEIDIDAVNTIIREVVDFVNQPNIRYRFQAQLLNFQMTEQTLALPDDLTIRRLTEQEVSAFHGGSVYMRSFSSMQNFGIHEFVIEGEGQVPKVFEDSPDNIEHPLQKVRSLLDKAVICLRTFKSGPVGYNYINFAPSSFCPFPFGTHGSIDQYVASGRYEILANELTPLQDYAEQIFKVLDPAKNPAMYMACSRLADAENRTHTQNRDRIVDAVIGMEALLLQASSKNELNFRFSLYYSSLFPKEDRYKEYNFAKELYALRSEVAHGNKPKDTYNLGGEKLSLAESAKRATQALRTVIRFLLDPVEFEKYTNSDGYWLNRILGLQEDCKKLGKL